MSVNRRSNVPFFLNCITQHLEHLTGRSFLIRLVDTSRHFLVTKFYSKHVFVNDVITVGSNVGTMLSNQDRAPDEKVFLLSEYDNKV